MLTLAFPLGVDGGGYSRLRSQVARDEAGSKANPGGSRLVTRVQHQGCIRQGSWLPLAKTDSD